MTGHVVLALPRRASASSEDPENDTNAYKALTDLTQLDSQGQIKIAGAVIARDMTVAST